MSKNAMFRVAAGIFPLVGTAALALLGTLVQQHPGEPGQAAQTTVVVLTMVLGGLVALSTFGRFRPLRAHTYILGGGIGTACLAQVLVPGLPVWNLPVEHTAGLGVLLLALAVWAAGGFHLPTRLFRPPG